MKLKDQYHRLPEPARASFWLAISSILQKGITLITAPIFTRLLDAEEFGRFSVFMSWLSFAQVLLTMNLCYGVYIQGLIKFKDDRRRYATSLLSLSMLGVLLASITYAILWRPINAITGLTTPESVSLLVLTSTTTGFLFWAGEKRVTWNYRSLVLLSVATSLLKPGLGVVLVLNSSDPVHGRVFGLVFVECMLFGWTFYYFFKRAAKPIDTTYWHYGVKLGLPLLPHYLAQFLLATSDRILIERILDARSAGIYSLAYSIGQLMIVLTQSITQAIEPWMYTQIAQSRFADLRQTAYGLLILVAVANVALISFAPEVVAFFAPAEYAEASKVVAPIAVSTFFMFSYNFFAIFEFYYERTTFIAIATMLGGALNVALNVGLLPTYGYRAAAYATLACYITFSFAHYIFMSRLLKSRGVSDRPYSLAVLLAIATAFISFSIVGVILSTHPRVRLACILATSLGTALLLITKRDKVKTMLSPLR